MCTTTDVRKSQSVSQTYAHRQIIVLTGEGTGDVKEGYEVFEEIGISDKVHTCEML